MIMDDCDRLFLLQSSLSPHFYYPRSALLLKMDNFRPGVGIFEHRPKRLRASRENALVF